MLGKESFASRQSRIAACFGVDSRVRDHECRPRVTERQHNSVLIELLFVDSVYRRLCKENPVTVIFAFGTSRFCQAQRPSLLHGKLRTCRKAR